MSSYVMGLDGGSSKSHLALFDTTGKRIDFIEWGPLNHEGMDGGMDELEQELNLLMAHALSRNGLSMDELALGVFGMSGVDNSRQHQAITGMYYRLGMKNIEVFNDAYLPILAVCPLGYGIGSINGTGCSAAGIGADGGTLQVGGCGELSGDIGGGPKMGEAAAKAVYCSIFKGGMQTIMKDMLFERLGVTRDEDYVETLTGQLEEGQISLSDINRILFRAADLGDEKALSMLAVIGEDSAMAILEIMKRLHFPEGAPVDVSLAGSVYVKGSNPRLVDALKRRVIEGAPGREIRFTVTDCPPVTGAVVRALKDFIPPAQAIPLVTGQM